MAIDVFGHPPRQLPDTNLGEWSEGPERIVGPPCWQGETTPCDGPCSDHQGCCDACRHHELQICGRHCCRCVPMAICVVFRPDAAEAEESTKCRVRSWKVPAVTGESDDRTTYTVSLAGNTIVLSVGQPEIGSPLFGTASCTWRLEVEALSIDDEHEVTHQKGEINCLQLPDFLIEDFDFPYDIGETTYTCIGDVEFSSWEMDKLPYAKRHWYLDETDALDPVCGDCDEVCTVLAVYRGTEDDFGYSSDSCDEFLWDGLTRKWQTVDGTYEEILLIEIDGECFLQLKNWGEETFEDDLIALPPGACALGLTLTARDEIGNWIKVSCKPCSCWKHVCGTCRCVPETLCVIGFDDGVLQGPYELTWDKDYFQWAGGSSDPVIQLSSDEDGNCQATITGYETPIRIDNACGTDITMTFANSVEENLTAFSFYAAWPKACEGSCNTGTCLTDCEDVPQVLYAQITPLDWTPMLGCEGPGNTKCFTPFTVPLAQMFIPTVLNPAGEWRWVGGLNFDCTGCDTGGNPGFKTERSNFVAIDIGCDGTGTADFTGPAESGGTFTETLPIDFYLPCGESTDWNLGPWDTGPTGGDLICCNEAGFSVSISDEE